MRIVIPGIPPSVNHAYLPARGRRGSRVLSQTAREWKEAVAWAAKAAKARSGWKCPPPGQKVVVDLWIYWPDSRRRDPDNTWKLVLDGLVQGHVLSDDRWALPRVMDWGVDRQFPRVEVEVFALEAMPCPSR